MLWIKHSKHYKNTYCRSILDFLHLFSNKKAVTLEEFYQLEQDLQASGHNNKEYLIAKGIKPYQSYYWKRKAREQSAGSLPVGGSFLPINIQGSGLLGKGKGNLEELLPAEWAKSQENKQL